METFYIIVLSVAVVLLILVLAFYGAFINTAVKANAAYPPQPSPTCPDYWTVNADGACIIPTPAPTSKNLGSIYKLQVDPVTNQPKRNPDGTPIYGAMALDGNSTPGLNSLPPGSIDFTNKDWSKGGTNALCNHKAWANSANVMWDGVSNYNGC